MELPDRDAVFARVRKRQLLLCIISLFLLVVGSSVWAWTRTDNYQFRRVAIASRSAVSSAESFAAARYVETLATSPRAADAVDQARALLDRDFRALSLAGVSRGLASVGRNELAGSTADDAMALATEIQDPHMRSMVLLTLAEAFFQLHELSKSDDAAQGSLNSGLQIEHPELRAEILCDVIRRSIQSRATALAQAAAKALIKAARGITNQGPQVYSLSCAATVADTSAGAVGPILQEALNISKSIASARIRAETLANVAELFAAIGSVPQGRYVAEQAFESALSIAGAPRAFVLVNRILPALESTKYASLMEEGASVALDDALRDSKPDSRARGVAAALRWIVKVRPQMDPAILVREAREAAANVEDPDRRIDVLSVVSHDIAKAQLGVAFDIAWEALEAVPTHTDDRGQSVAYAQIAAAFAELGWLRQARLAAERCTSSTDRLSAFEQILKRSRLQAPNTRSQ